MCGRHVRQQHILLYSSSINTVVILSGVAQTARYSHGFVFCYLLYYALPLRIVFLLLSAYLYSSRSVTSWTITLEVRPQQTVPRYTKASLLGHDPRSWWVERWTRRVLWVRSPHFHEDLYPLSQHQLAFGAQTGLRELSTVHAARYLFVEMIRVHNL